LSNLDWQVETMGTMREVRNKFKNKKRKPVDVGRKVLVAILRRIFGGV
jgi:hypothetical protein